MILNFYTRVAVKLGDERYEYDRSALMFQDVVEIERASGLSFAEWEWQAARGSLLATAALLHALRKRAGVPSDFDTINFAAFDLILAPLHDDGSEFTQDEVAEDIQKRIAEGKAASNGKQPDPTTAAEDSAAGQVTPGQATTPSTFPTSPSTTTSHRTTGNGSAGASLKPSKKQRTHS